MCLITVEATSSTAFLVNNRTPTKLSRSASLPSFASLGAAFRPGQPPPLGLPSFIPKPPILPMDEDSEDEMDWFTGDEAVTSTIATPVKESTLEGADWFVADTPLKA